MGFVGDALFLRTSAEWGERWSHWSTRKDVLCFQTRKEGDVSGTGRWAAAWRGGKRRTQSSSWVLEGRSTRLSTSKSASHVVCAADATLTMLFHAAALLVFPLLWAHQVPVGAQHGCVQWPNSTAIAANYFQCDSSPGNLFELHDAAITNNTGDDEYPVDLTKPIRIFLDVTNLSGRRYYNLAMDTVFYRRSNGWLGCGWSIIPNFGYLMNKDHCEENPSCPVQLGRQILEAKIDASAVFTKYLGLFYGNDIPYQLMLRFKDTTDPINQKEILCVVWQMKVKL